MSKILFDTIASGTTRSGCVPRLSHLTSNPAGYSDGVIRLYRNDDSQLPDRLA